MTAEATSVRVSSPSYQAFQILHIAFTVAPIVAGLDKFFHALVDWDMYLSPMIARMLPVISRQSSGVGRSRQSSVAGLSLRS